MRMSLRDRLVPSRGPLFGRSACAMVALAAGVSLGLGGCADPPPERSPQAIRSSERRNQIQVEDVEVVITSGTLAMRAVRAAYATFHEDTRFLEGSSVTLRLFLPKRDLDLTARASRGEVFLAPEDKKTDQDLAATGPVGYPAMRDIVYRPEERRPFGDVILYGPVRGSTSDGGTFRTQTVYWSEKHKRLLVPHPFEQIAFLPDGDALAMSGSAFEVDSTLRNWEYYGDTEPWVLTWRSGPHVQVDPASPTPTLVPSGGATSPR